VQEFTTNLVKSADPLCTIVSPPYTPWFNNNVNYERWEKKEAERELWRPTLRWLAKLMEERISTGRDVVFV